MRRIERNLEVTKLNREIRGSVTSGTGRGAGFIALPIYFKLFTELLGQEPFLGTLNLRLNKEDAGYVNESFEKGNFVDDMEYEGKTYGGVITIPIEIPHDENAIPAIAVRPLRTSHHVDVIELIAPFHLRSMFNLDDGDLFSFNL